MRAGPRRSCILFESQQSANGTVSWLQFECGQCSPSGWWNLERCTVVEFAGPEIAEQRHRLMGQMRAGGMASYNLYTSSETMYAIEAYDWNLPCRLLWLIGQLHRLGSSGNTTYAGLHLPSIFRRFGEFIGTVHLVESAPGTKRCASKWWATSKSTNYFTLPQPHVQRCLSLRAKQ